jgi:hypothetical protein
MKNGLSQRASRIGCCFLLVAALSFSGCSDRSAITEKHFVGKWKSSKLMTPVYLYANGEWEIKSADGAILQFGVWEYKDRKITWSYKVDSHIGHDTNAVLSATPGEFRVRESDNTTTVFTKLDSL